MELNSIHTILEVSITVCLFFFAWINFRCVPHERYSIILAIGATAAGFASIIHAIISVMSIDVPGVIPIMSDTAQLVLISTFLLIGICSNTTKCSTFAITLASTWPLILGGAFAVFQILTTPIELFAPITITDNLIIQYPCYLLMTIGWIVVGIISHARWKYIFPPYSGLIFFVYTVAANIMLAFINPSSLEFCAVLALSLELAGLYTIILMYLISNYHFAIAHGDRRCSIADRRISYPTGRH